MAGEIFTAGSSFKKRRIFAVIPLNYAGQAGFWTRDVGLVIRALHAMGHDAWLVTLEAGHVPDPQSRMILSTQAELEDPQWWRRQQPDAIILNTWSATRYQAIRAAALSLGKPVIEKLDTDGVKSPRIWLARHFHRDAVDYRHSDPFYKKLKMILTALARTIVVRLFPALLDAKMVRYMSQVPVYAVESPLATARVKRFLRLFHASPMPRVLTIPHPADTSQMKLLPSDVKENIVIAVGRWDDAVKGWPLLFGIARRFLVMRPDWKMVVVGPEPRLSAADRREVERFEGRLLIAGSLDHTRLSDWYRRAKIYLLTSHWETFNIAAAEALCCGCSVVGPAQIASVTYFTGWQSGTPSYKRTPDHMTDALVAEVDQWENHKRDPAAISRTAIQALSVEAIANTYLQTFQEMERSYATTV